MLINCRSRYFCTNTSPSKLSDIFLVLCLWNVKRRNTSKFTSCKKSHPLHYTYILLTWTCKDLLYHVLPCSFSSRQGVTHLTWTSCLVTWQMNQEVEISNNPSEFRKRLCVVLSPKYYTKVLLLRLSRVIHTEVNIELNLMKQLFLSYDTVYTLISFQVNRTWS